MRTGVPARDFVLSKKFYQDLGFELAWHWAHRGAHLGDPPPRNG
jgi:hypothetical protein